MKGISRVVVTTTVAIAVLASTALPAHAIKPEPNAPRAGLFCPCWGGAPKSAATWTEAAKTHSVIVAARSTVLANYSKAKQANPKVVLLPYVLGPYLSKNTAAFNNTLANFPERFARDKNNNLVTPPQFPNNVLMDMGVPGWQTQMADIAAAAAVGLDGVYVDSVGVGPLNGYTSAVPVDPKTGQNYTSFAWETAGKQILNLIKAKLGDKYVLFNGIASGDYYANKNTKILAESNADGGMTEAWVRMAKTSIDAYPSVTTLKQELAEMKDMRAKGKDFFAWTKTWSTPDATEQQKAAWNTYAFAVFLLGTGGRAFYAFTGKNGGDRSPVPYPVSKYNIGKPKGNYTLVNGVFKREFDFVSVTVNVNTKTATITQK